MSNDKVNKFVETGLEIDGDILFITVAKYKLFLSYGKKGADALMLYLHYMFTARMQQTNSVWANNSYVREGLNWSRDRLKDAKKLLSQLGLIYQKKPEKLKDGTFGKPYIIVKTKTTPFEIENVTGVLKNHIVDDPQGGQKDANALTKNLNALTSNLSIYTELLDLWIEVGLPKHDINTVTNNIKAKHLKIIKDIGKGVFIDMIKEYSTILKSDLHYFTHTYTLWNFISKGYTNFLPETNPKYTWLSNKNKKQSTRKTSVTDLMKGDN